MTEPGTVMAELETLEREMAANQNDLETAAHDDELYSKRWDARLAYYGVKTEGANAEQRKAKTFVAAFEHDDGELYKLMTEAAAQYSALSKGQRSRESRATIKMSILRGLGRG